MSALEKASVLRERHRYEEAVAVLYEHLAQEPQDAWAYAMLAETQMEMPGKKREALTSIESAIAIEADTALLFALKGLILSTLDKDKAALEVSDEAIRLDPSVVLAWLARSQALGGMSRWAESEKAVREALKLAPDHQGAQNSLSICLRMQGRVEESARGADQRLARDPEDAVAHANSGWAALHRGEREKADVHFREALRLDPDSEYARLGLRETYKARSPLYRAYLRWVFFMQRFSAGQRWLIIIGIYLAYRFGRALLAQVHPLAAAALVVVYLLFCCWSFLASGVGHGLMLTDRWARMTLNRREKLDGLLVGIFFPLGVLLMVLGLTVLPLGFAFLGGGLALGALPVSQITLNYSKAGLMVFGAISLLVYVAGVVGFLVGLDGSNPLQSGFGDLFMLAILGTVLTTWLSAVPGLHSHGEE